MAIQLSSVFANNLLGTGTQGVATQIGGGTLVLYSGTPPSGPNQALSGNTSLATWTFSAAGSQGTPTAGVMNLAFVALTVTASLAGGPLTATFWRILSSGAAVLIQGTAGTVGTDWILTNTSINNGDNVSVTGVPSVSWAVA